MKCLELIIQTPRKHKLFLLKEKIELFFLLMNLFCLGARSEGVEGFFKGIGKGLLGLLTHPTGGVIDMVSFTLDGVRRLPLFCCKFSCCSFTIFAGLT